MSKLVRASLSIEEDLLQRFDQLVETSGHENRSEAIRDLIRARLIEEEWSQNEHQTAVATVTLVYDHSKRQLAYQIEEHGHQHHDVVTSSMHIHLSPNICLEIIVLKGSPSKLTHVANYLIGLPGVLHGKAVYSQYEPEVTP